MSKSSSLTSKPIFVVLSLVLLGAVGYWVWTTQYAPITCDSKAAHAELKTLGDKGIRNTGHGSSLTNLLWIYVGPKWHALPLKEKRSIDKIVTCAAQTIDDQGQPTWQAAYYDYKSGKMAALTSKRYGFRLKTPE
ncbi:MAG: hypothetical protein ACE1ZK_05335 [Nitrospirales bacterium]